VTVPVTQSPGGYYIIAKADAGNVVAESAEGNNTRYVFITVNP
jgi:subtilase family serine protease